MIHEEAGAAADHSAEKKVLRIALIVPWITKSRGGTENVGHMMANALASRGHDVHIFTFDDQQLPSRWPLHETVELHWLPEAETPSADSIVLFSIAEICPDLIIGLHMNRTLLRYTLLAQRMSVPIILSEHIDPRFPRRLGVFTEQERNVAFEGATKVHLLTTSFLDTVLPEHREKVVVIPNTVTEPTRLSSPVGDGANAVITVARLVPRKNIERLIKEFAQIAGDFPDWTLRILGDGPLTTKLQDCAKAAGVARQVEFLGHSDEPYEHLAAARLFVLPSLFEGFPMSSLEAMAHGIPLVGYATCNGINEQIVDGENGLLVADSLDFGGLGKAMAKIMGSAELRGKMGEASRARFLAFYSNDVIGDLWEKMALAAHAAGIGFPEQSQISAVRADLAARMNSTG